MCLLNSNLINKKRGRIESKFLYLMNYPLATISWMASLTLSSSDLTASFIATSFGPSSPKDKRTSTFTFPMNTPDNKQVCDLELGGTASVPCKAHKQKMIRYHLPEYNSQKQVSRHQQKIPHSSHLRISQLLIESEKYLTPRWIYKSSVQIM